MLRVEDAPEPSVRKDEVLVDVVASSVNPVDTKIRNGSQRTIIRLKFPAILGMDVAGKVKAVGADVHDFNVGDRVFASPHHTRMGSYAERMAVRASELAKIPEGLSFEDAASIPLAGLTAWDSLVRHGNVKEGSRVLIQAGAGGVGSLAIQIAKALGAKVYATSSSKNIDLLKSLGTDVPIDYAKENYEDVAKDCDLVVDCLGPDHFDRALRTVRKGGIIVGLTAGIPEAVEKHGAVFGIVVAFFQLLAFLLKARLTKGVKFKPIARNPDGKALAKLGELVREGKVKALVQEVIPLNDIVRAHELMEEGRTRGKLVLRVQSR